MKLKTLAILFGLTLGTVTQAFAVTTIPLGTITAPNTYSSLVTVAPGLFEDKFTFSISDTLFSSGFIGNTSIGNMFDIQNLAASLYIDGNFATALTSNGDPNYLSGQGIFTPGHTYYFDVTGNATGTAGGAFTYAVLTAPVPEPSNLALMASGLGLLGFMSLRRRKPD